MNIRCNFVFEEDGMIYFIKYIYVVADYCIDESTNEKVVYYCIYGYAENEKGLIYLNLAFDEVTEAFEIAEKICKEYPTENLSFSNANSAPTLDISLFDGTQKKQKAYCI